MPGRDPFLGFAPFPADRLGLKRRDRAWLERSLSDPATRFVPVVGMRHPVEAPEGEGEEDAPRPVLLTPEEAAPLVREESAPILLGDAGGRACYALELPEDTLLEGAGHPRASLEDLRRLGTLLPAEEVSLLAYARGMAWWHHRHRFCGVCGRPTASEEAGHLRVCTGCGEKHFPRTDPAVIMLVTHGEGEDERALLARQPRWAERVYSTLAGFVEPGEGLEAAVAREVLEETGVHLEEVRYQRSQPWPFPGSIMIGFYARARTVELTLDPEEIEDARWLGREEIRREVAAGTLRLPSGYSIARYLVEGWLEGGNDER